MNQGLTADDLAKEAEKKKPKKKKKDPLAGLPPDRRAAVEVTKAMYKRWVAPIQTLGKVRFDEFATSERVLMQCLHTCF